MISKVVINDCDFIKLKANKKKLFEDVFKSVYGRPDQTLKKNIEKSVDYAGNPLKPLQQSTLKIRKLKGISGNQPLVEKGKLKDTIRWKPTKKGGKLSFNKYGWYQAEGYTTKNIFAVKKGRKIKGFRDYSDGVKVEARPFINPESPGDGLIQSNEKSLKNTIKNIKLNMKGRRVYRK